LVRRSLARWPPISETWRSGRARDWCRLPATGSPAAWPNSAATRAVALIGTHANPILTTNSIALTIDTITAPTELAAFTLISEGMLAFPQPARHPRHRVCALGTGVIALAMPITGGTCA
jgi:hypothetical protein